MQLDLTNKKVLVTGSSRGLGFEIAKSFLSESADVLITGRDSRFLLKQQEVLRAQFIDRRCDRLSCDLTTDEGGNNLLAYIKKEWGRLDVLVCNIGSGKSCPTLTEMPMDWERQFSVNFFTAVNAIRLFTPLLEQSATTSCFSAITLVNSICSREALGAPTTYSASKAALLAHAKAISTPLASKQIRVNTISPGNMIFSGSTWEDKLKQNQVAIEEMLENHVALKRLGTAEEVARVVTFLSSPAASFVCGSNWIVDGGQLRSI